MFTETSPRFHPSASALSSHPHRMPSLRLILADLQTLSAPSAESLGRSGGGPDDRPTWKSASVVNAASCLI
jgi:hypothetical protein